MKGLSYVVLSKYPSGYTQQGGPASAAIAGQSGKMLQMQLLEINNNINAIKEGAEQPFFLVSDLMNDDKNASGNVSSGDGPKKAKPNQTLGPVTSGSKASGFQFGNVSTTYYQLDFWGSGRGQGNGGVLNADGGSLLDMKNNPPDHPEYEAPKGGDRKVKNPNGSGSGWIDNKGRVWVPSDNKGNHARHWGRQKPGGGYENVYPTSTQLIQGGLILGGAAIIIFDILTIPSGEGLIGIEMIRRAVAP